MRITLPQPQKAQRGAALIAVLWLIAVLGIATMAALRVISFDMEVASAKIHGSRARQMAEMGIAVACNPAVERTDPILRRFDEGTGEGFEARIRSEGGRFNINMLIGQQDNDLLRSIFAHWGLNFEESQALADALADWVDANEEVALNGAEIKEYEKIGRVNQPFNRPFYDLSEMRLVIGMEQVEALRPDWRNWFTVWSGGALDVNEAEPELVALASESTIEQAELIQESISGPDGVRHTDDDVYFEEAAAALDLLGLGAESPLAKRFTANDPTARIESIGQAEGAKRKITVIIRNRNGKPALLERTEEIIP